MVVHTVIHKGFTRLYLFLHTGTYPYCAEVSLAAVRVRGWTLRPRSQCRAIVSQAFALAPLAKPPRGPGRNC